MSESVKKMMHMDCSQSDHHDKLSIDDIDQVLKVKMTIVDKTRDKTRDPFSDAAGIDKIINISTGEALLSTELPERQSILGWHQ